MVKTTVVALALMALAPSAAQASPSSFGVVGGEPQLAGLFASTYVGPDVTLDAQVTLTLIDVGSTYHMPIGRDLSLLAAWFGGYIHNMVSNHWYDYTGWHLGAKVGLGFERGLDLRVEGGVSFQKTALDGGWGLKPAVDLMVGFVF